MTTGRKIAFAVVAALVLLPSIVRDLDALRIGTIHVLGGILPGEVVPTPTPTPRPEPEPHPAPKPDPQPTPPPTPPTPDGDPVAIKLGSDQRAAVVAALAQALESAAANDSATDFPSVVSRYQLDYENARVAAWKPVADEIVKRWGPTPPPSSLPAVRSFLGDVAKGVGSR